MNSDINELAGAVLKKPLQECSLDELQQIAEEFPYFGPVQLLLAKKLSEASFQQESNLAQYEEQVQKASLYFQNRVWLHHLLNKDGGGSSFSRHTIVPETESPATSEEQDRPVASTTNENKEMDTNSEPVEEQVNEQMAASVETASINIQPDDQVVRTESEEYPLNLATGKDETTEPTYSPVEMPSLKFEPIAPNASLLFEPYHTVDYFASQGIKFKEEDKPKDQFSKQLKSFTEWLKTLKQVPISEIAKSVDGNAEKKVEQMAEYSLAERHVITEAMAEVWKKQGNKAKAEDIYHKLSLLDPSKSSYFAAKIEDLKKTS